MRARRAAAWLIDTGPLWLALALIGPLAFLQALFRVREASDGVGIVDPAHGGGLMGGGARSITPIVGAALLLVVGWALVQVTAIAAARRTVGKNLLGLDLVFGDDRPSRGRVLLRELARFALLAALPLIETVPRGGPAAPPSAWRAYAPHVAATGPIWATLIVTGGLMIAAVCAAIADGVAVAGDPAACTLGDRLARTRVVRSR